MQIQVWFEGAGPFLLPGVATGPPTWPATRSRPNSYPSSSLFRFSSSSVHSRKHTHTHTLSLIRLLSQGLPRRRRAFSPALDRTSLDASWLRRSQSNLDSSLNQPSSSSPPLRAMSDSLRPPTTGRPSTANSRTRPVTSNAQRPDTAVSSISSLGPAPHTFRPDLDDFDDDEDDGEPAESESETEDNVFAFHRPQTGAVPGFGSTLSPLSEGGTFSAPPTTAATRYGGPPPSTAQFSVAPPSLAYSQTDFQAQPNSGRRASYSPYSASSTNEGQDGATTSEEGASLEVHALPPVQFVHPKPDGSFDPSSFAGSSKGGRDTEDGRGRSEYLESESSSLASLSALGSDSVGPQAVRMRSFQPLVESGGQRRRRSVKYAETEPGSDEGTGIETWVSHSLAGPTTIPHGAMEQHYEDEYEKYVLFTPCHFVCAAAVD